MKAVDFNASLAALLSLFDTYEQLTDSIVSTQPYDLALGLLDQVVKEVSFVQVGANDGQTGDRLRRFVANSKWTGIMIEPHPEAFSKLESLYKDARDRITLINKAVTMQVGVVELLEPETRFGSLTASISKDCGWAGNARIKRTFQVDGIPLSNLLKENGVRRVDLLQIDVEGCDFEVLMTLDLDVLRPALISYEDRHFFPPGKRTEAVKYLRDRGYKVLVGMPPQDTLAVDEKALRALLSEKP